FNLPYGSPGTITDGTHYWPLPRGQNGTSLSVAGLSQGVPNLYDQKEGTYVSPREQRWRVFGRESLRPTAGLGRFARGLVTRRKVQTLQASSNPLILSVPESNPFYVNPTGNPGPVTVETGTSAFFGPLIGDDRVDTGNFSLGATAATSRGWMLT